jgi:hypothetical protein
MAMGVDEAGQEDGVAEVHDLGAGGGFEFRGQIVPCADDGDAAVKNEHGAVFDRGCGNGENDARTQDEEICHAHLLNQRTLNSDGAFDFLQFGCVLVFARFNFTVAFADLLLDFFGDDVNGRVQIAFTRLGKEVGAAHGHLHRANELPFGHAAVVVFEGNAGINGAAIQMIQLFELLYNAVFEGPGERNVVE